MNKKEKELYLRNFLASKGVEKTPDEAAEIFKKAKELIRFAKKMTQVDIWQLEENLKDEPSLTEQEKREAVEAIQHARGV
jgi:hypothetical protein